MSHTAQRVRDPEDKEWQREGIAFSMQWTASLRDQARSSSSHRWKRSSNLLEDPALCRHPSHKRDDGYWLLPIYRSLKEGGAFGQDHSQVLVLDPDGSSTKQI